MKNKSDLHSLLKEKSILIISYEINLQGKTSHYLSGPSQDLLVYLRERSKRVVFFEQPDPISDDLSPKAKVYEKGKLFREIIFPMCWFPLKKGRREIASNPFFYFLFKFRDFLSTIYFMIRLRSVFDVMIAVESPNTLMAILMRALHLSKIVIYDMIDYSPNRFKNGFLNSIFYFLDKLCVKKADYVWNQTDRVAKERLKRGCRPENCAPQLVKPTGVLVNKIAQNPIGQINRYQIIYMGSLLKRDGVDLLLEAFIQVLKSIPSARLIIIGEGQLKIQMEKRIAQEGIAQSCQFLGMIGDELKLEKILRESAIGVAPYANEKETVKIFNDVSKPKVYLSCGLPVVITQVAPVSEEIHRRQAGIAVAFDIESLAQALIKLLDDDAFFQECRKQALRMAKDYSWDKIFDRLFLPLFESKK